MASRSNGPRPQLLAALGVSVKPASEVTAGRGRLELPALAAQESEGLPLAHLAMLSGLTSAVLACASDETQLPAHG
jgi:hypothetical protein